MRKALLIVGIVVTAVVAIVWAVAMLATVFRPSYEPPDSVHLIFTTVVVGLVSVLTIFGRGRNGNGNGNGRGEKK